MPADPDRPIPLSDTSAALSDRILHWVTLRGSQLKVFTSLFTIQHYIVQGSSLHRFKYTYYAGPVATPQHRVSSLLDKPGFTGRDSLPRDPSCSEYPKACCTQRQEAQSEDRPTQSLHCQGLTTSMNCDQRTIRQSYKMKRDVPRNDWVPRAASSYSRNMHHSTCHSLHNTFKGNAFIQ
jgi:hypothetical protein